MSTTTRKLTTNLGDGLKGGLRIGQTMSVLTRTGLGWLAGRRPPTPQLLRETFERLGTTYIKLGQFIASAPSVFPEAYVKEFQLCLDRVEPLPYKTIEKTLRKEFPQPIEDIFEHIDPTPLASASIAQVHAARLTTGEDVVIKVQKPGVRNVLLTDLNFLFVTSKVLEWLVPHLVHASLSDIVNEIQKGMLAECDFLQEAQNIETFDKYLKETGNTEAAVPKVYHHATTLKVLTMERFYGVPLTDLESIKAHSRDPEFTLLTAMNTWMGSLLHCQFFHADVHAGNLMVLQDGRIGFIDFGIVGSLKPGTWEAMISFMTGKATESYTSMAEALVKIGVADRKVEISKLAYDLEQLVRHAESMDSRMIGNPMDMDNAEMDRFMLSIVELGKKHGIKFPREFALLLKQILYFDRYIELLAPGMNMFNDERVILDGDMPGMSSMGMLY